MDFRGDERGQPVQIGFILLFGILVLAFAGYQGYVVPNQNAQVEFQHSQEATQEMQTFREDFLNSAEDGERFSAGFTLGTDYQPRLIALNPPPASGKLRTERPGDGRFYMNTGDESLAEICGIETDGDGGVSSNALVYQPSYNEYQDGPKVVYENTVTYNRFTRNDAVTLTTEQTIIQGTDIMIPPLVGDVSEDGTERHTVDLYPGKAGVGEASGSAVNLTIPTDLSADQWRELLADQMDADGQVEAVTANGSSVDVVLEPGLYDITCPVIGAGEKPQNTPARVRGEGDEINPAAPGNVRLVGSELNGDVATLTFQNTGDAINITEARLNFYEAQSQGNPPTEADISKQNEQTSATLAVGSDFETLDPEINFTGRTTTNLEMAFDGSPNKQDWFVLTVVFESGEQGLYFIGMEDSFGGGGGGGDAASGVAYNGDATFYWNMDSVDFSVTNTGSQDVVLERMTVTEDGSADTIFEPNGGVGPGQREIYVASPTDPGYLETGDNSNSNSANNEYTLGDDVSLTDSATIGAGESADVYFTTFHSGSGSGRQSVSVFGDEITVTMTFSDGSQKTFSFTVTSW